MALTVVVIAPQLPAYPPKPPPHLAALEYRLVAGSSDDCAQPISVSDGDNPFDTTSASSGNPPAPCFADQQVHNDRWFLYRIATHILAFEGDGKVRWFEGNYQAYVAKRREEIGDQAENPHRIKYKKLVSG